MSSSFLRATMELKNPEDGRNQNEDEEEEEEEGEVNQNQQYNEDIDSTCSTPYVSAPSSPGHVSSGYFFSAPASPMHFVLSSSAAATASSKAYVSSSSSSSDVSVSGSFEFEFSSRFSSNASAAVGSMISADELFLNGQIRPMKLSSHLLRPQLLAPLMDLEVEDEDDDEVKDEKDLELVKTKHSVVRGRDLRLRNRSLHRRTRSLSPLRNTSSFQWEEEEEHREEREMMNERDLDLEQKESEETPSTETTPSVSASSSRSSSSGRSSKRWVFLKDFLRSKSEGRGNAKDKFWQSLSFSPAKDRKSSSSSIIKDKIPISSISSKPETQTQKSKAAAQPVPAKKTGAGKPANGVAKRRRPPSPHELHYTANRAQAEEMKKRTFLPYRQGLLGCLGFSSKGYGAMNGFARSLNPVSSR